MGAGHGGDTTAIARGVGRIVWVVLVPLIAVTVAGLVIFWPSEPTPTIAVGDFYDGTVVQLRDCEPPSDVCTVAIATVDEGPDTGDTAAITVNIGPATPVLDVGTQVILVRTPDAPDGAEYGLVDIKRTRPLIVLAGLFAAAVVLLAGWKGVSALVGLVSSLVILAVFVLPALLLGSPPVAVAAIGAAAIAIVSMAFAHGLNVRTGIALIGTLIALTLTAVLGWVFTTAMQFTGIGSDDAAYLQAVAGSIDLRGLLLAGLVIGALGVLDDVTVTQAAAVTEVNAAGTDLSVGQLYAAGMRVGKDHVAATVNTLVLAYVGASLPLFLLITMSEAPLGQSLTNEVIASEIVRSLVGGLGIVAAVPVTTLLAAAVIVDARRRIR